MSNWFAIDHLHALRLTGRDVEAFCQAQLTADVAAWQRRQWQITGWCNPKGRVIAVILAAANEDGVDLVFPTEQLDIAQKLRLYAIGREVVFSEPRPVEGSFTNEPGDLCLALEAGRALRVGRGEAPEDPTDPASDRLRWRIADICLPLPWLTAATSARYLPQALGLEDNGGLSYTKGCFPGQEVIARVHYRGRVTHRLLGFELDATDESELEPGVELRQASGARAAEILTCVRLGEKLIGLGVSPVEVEPGTEIGLATGAEPASGRMATPDRLCYHREEQAIIDPESLG
jgi:folate-binding protein YgfZ